MKPKVIENLLNFVKSFDILWILEIFEICKIFKKNFGLQQTGQNYLTHSKAQLGYSEFLAHMAGFKIWTFSPELNGKNIRLDWNPNYDFLNILKKSFSEASKQIL